MQTQTEIAVNRLKDQYDLLWSFGSDLPPHGGIIWYRPDGEFLVRISIGAGMDVILLEAIKEAKLTPRSYYPPLKKTFKLASSLDVEPHLINSEENICPIPDLIDHPSSFAHVRGRHVHEGVDLYAEDGDSVHAMLPGTVVGIDPNFTGPGAGSPWWNQTMSIAVEDETGVWIYGEIVVDPHLQVGSTVAAGDHLGRVTPVLIKDNGYPKSMLHLERYVSGTTKSIGIWALDSKQPDGLLDPTSLLIEGLRVS